MSFPYGTTIKLLRDSELVWDCSSVPICGQRLTILWLFQVTYERTQHYTYRSLRGFASKPTSKTSSTPGTSPTQTVIQTSRRDRELVYGRALSRGSRDGR